MKWRHTFIYLVILIAAGGYYYFHQVHEAGKEAAQTAALRVFSIQREDLRALEISTEGEKTIRLSKNGSWKIMQPIEAETDEFVLEQYGEMLAGLTKEREVEARWDDRQRFGLDPPALRIRFRGHNGWKDLLLGDRNPFGEGFYATTSESEEIFLIGSGMAEGFFQGVDGLRRSQLFSFSPQDVVKLRVQWHGGLTLEVVQRGDGGETFWVDPRNEEKKIRTSRVENVLQQIQWLRARSFLEDEVVNLESHGLEPPLVTVEMELQDEGVAFLRLGRPETQSAVLTALSSQLKGVVEIAPTIYDDLPQDVRAFWDRSILTQEAQQVLEVKWVLRGEEGHVIRRGDDQWDSLGEGKTRPVRESWLLRSLLWNIKDMEYEKERGGMGMETLQGHEMSERLQLLGEEGLLTSLSWKPVDRDSIELQTLELLRDGESLEVLIHPESLEKIEFGVQDVMRSLGKE